MSSRPKGRSPGAPARRLSCPGTYSCARRRTAIPPWNCASCRNGPCHRNFSAVLRRRSASVWLLLRAHLAVDLQEAREQIAGAAGIDLVDHLFQKRVVSSSSRVRNFFGKTLNQNAPWLRSRRDFARKPSGIDSPRQVPGIGEQREALVRRSRPAWESCGTDTCPRARPLRSSSRRR